MNLKDDYLDRELLLLAMDAQSEDEEPEAMTRCTGCGNPISDDSIYPTCDDCEAH